MKRAASVVVAVVLGFLCVGAMWDFLIQGRLGKIIIDAQPGYNDYVGTVRRVVPATNVTLGDIVYVSTSMGPGFPYVRKADADASNTVGDIMIMVETANSGGVAKALTDGVMHCSSWAFDGPGLPVYVSTTSGLAVTTAPSGSGDQVQKIGYTESSGTIRVKPSLNITENP